MWIAWLALALAGLGIAMRIRAGYPRAPQGLRVLSAGEVAFLAAAADATFPPGGAIAPSGSDAHVPEYLDRYLAAVPPKLRRLMRLLFFLLEHATLIFPPGGSTGLRRFSSLPPAARIAYLASWRQSRLFPRRLVFTSLRSILGLAYLADPAVQRALNLAPKRIPSPPSDGTPLDPDGPLDPAYEARRG